MAVIADNLQGLTNRVRRWLHEIDADNSFWSDTFIAQMINVSYRRRSAQLVMAFEGFFTNVAARDLVADQERYAWPGGFERLRKMEMVQSGGSTMPIERDERHYSAKGAPSGGQGTYFPNYRPISGGFVLEPAPSETITNGLRIEYHGLPTLLEADGDSLHVDFPRSFDELVVLDSVVASLDSENLLEMGGTRAALRMRAEWEVDFERYIDSRMISTNKIHPFNPHYPDA